MEAEAQAVPPGGGGVGGQGAAGDLRATGELACDDSALGLIDALFPALLAAGQSAEH